LTYCCGDKLLPQKRFYEKLYFFLVHCAFAISSTILFVSDNKFVYFIYSHLWLYNLEPSFIHALLRIARNSKQKQFDLHPESRSHTFRARTHSYRRFAICSSCICQTCFDRSERVFIRFHIRRYNRRLFDSYYRLHEQSWIESLLSGQISLFYSVFYKSSKTSFF